jgi:hypothetical protein
MGHSHSHSYTHYPSPQQPPAPAPAPAEQVAALTEQVQTLTEQVIVAEAKAVVAEAIAESAKRELKELKDLSEASQQRASRLVTLMTVGKDMAASAISKYLKEWDYTEAFDFVKKSFPDIEIVLDFASLDQEEREAIIKGALQRSHEILEEMIDADVSIDSIKALRKGIKWCDGNVAKIECNLAAYGRLCFTESPVDEKLKAEDTATITGEETEDTSVKKATPPESPKLIFSRSLTPPPAYLAEEAIQPENEELVKPVTIKFGVK